MEEGEKQGALILCTAGEVKVGAAAAAVIASAAAACLTHFPLSQVGSPAGESMCLVVPLLPRQPLPPMPATGWQPFCHMDIIADDLSFIQSFSLDCKPCHIKNVFIALLPV